MLAWETEPKVHSRRTCRYSHQLIGLIREEANRFGSERQSESLWDMLEVAEVADFVREPDVRKIFSRGSGITQRTPVWHDKTKPT